MPITNKRLDAAYYIHVSSSDIFDGYTFLELKTGDNFNNLSSQMSAINFMLSPDEFHPTKIKLKGKDVQVLVPATEIDGKAYLFYEGVVNGRISMKFEGGVFDKIGAGLFLKENQIDSNINKVYFIVSPWFCWINSIYEYIQNVYKFKRVSVTY